MISGNPLPLLLVLSSLIPGLIIFGLKEKRHRNIRIGLNVFAAVVKLFLIGMILPMIGTDGSAPETKIAFLPQLNLVLRADNLSILFVVLSAVFWLVTTLYAIGYLEKSPHRSRFFGFFSLCVSATMGIALAGNLLTFFIFYEFLTLCTYPLVVHKGGDEALRGGRTYLIYTLTGGAVLLVAIIWLHSLAASANMPLEFTPQGALAGLAADHANSLRIIFFMFMAALGVKTAFVPLHGWLPRAMVAPAPVSALLHAVAVVKAGAFGIVRVVYDLYGIETAHTLGLLQPLLVVACTTVIVGSVIALFQDDLKKRLAYSTVSQVSYIVIGVALFGPIGSSAGWFIWCIKG
jgi:multicomponent Na+:H+ antiporter subunit D